MDSHSAESGSRHVAIHTAVDGVMDPVCQGSALPPSSFVRYCHVSSCSTYQRLSLLCLPLGFISFLTNSLFCYCSQRTKTASVVRRSEFLATERKSIVFPVRYELNLFM
jgi:hypothetical protein